MEDLLLHEPLPDGFVVGATWPYQTAPLPCGATRFMDEYHQRSIIEAVFGAIKKMYGNHLRGRRRARQSREVAIRAICYNIEVVARSHVKSGRLTHESFTAMAA